MSKRSLVSLGGLFLAASCGVQYVPEDRQAANIVMSQEPWVTSATVDLENRGHSYKADAERTWRAVHQVLSRMGVRVKREQSDWHVIDETYHAATPSDEMAAFVRDFNRVSPEKAVAARYRLSVALMEEGPRRTTVVMRIFPEVKKAGSKDWLPVPSNRRILEYFYRTLDRMLPAYRDDSLPM